MTEVRETGESINGTVFVGIDPGVNGGISWIGSQLSFAVKMPTTELDLFKEIHRIKAAHFCCHAIIEKVHASPRRDKFGQEVKNGAASMFKFGQSYGSLRMALIAAGIPFDEVTPQKWQKELGLIRSNKNETITAKKNRHKAKAQQLFPELKITHATADALLIAEYCRRVNR